MMVRSSAVLLSSWHNTAPVDPVAHSLTLLGTIPDAQDSDKKLQAIIRVEKTSLPAQQGPTLITHFLKDVQFMENNDIVRSRYRIQVQIPEHTLVVYVVPWLARSLSRAPRSQDQHNMPRYRSAHSQGKLVYEL